jgi:nucleolar complex protein 3
VRLEKGSVFCLQRRLHSFSLAKISTPSHPEPVSNDIVIRKLTMLSELAVFDIIPGYRIRALMEKEKEEKVSQMVARTREWEHGLVAIYQPYLKSLEAELKGFLFLLLRSNWLSFLVSTPDFALQCICTLATEVKHFNFRVNVMSCIVARLSKKTWDEVCRPFRIPLKPYKDDLRHSSPHSYVWTRLSVSSVQIFLVSHP